MKRSLLRTLYGVPLLIASCQGGTLVHSYHAMDNARWEQCDTLVFPIDSVSTTADYEVEVGLRIGLRFPYRSLWMVVEQTDSTQQTIQRDTVEIVTADEDGRLLGDGLNCKQITQTAKPVHFECGERGSLRLFHIMAADTVPAVMDVGIRVAR